MMPQMSDPQRLPEFEPQEKLFATLSESSGWGKRLDLENVGALNDRIASGQMQRLILGAGGAAGEAAGGDRGVHRGAREREIRDDRGPSSSGKTTFAHRLSVQLEAIGFKPHPISVDNYFGEPGGQPA